MQERLSLSLKVHSNEVLDRVRKIIKSLQNYISDRIASIMLERNKPETQEDIERRRRILEIEDKLEGARIVREYNARRKKLLR